MPIPITGLFTPSGGADAFDLVAWHDVSSHNWAATTAPGIDNDINDTAVAESGYVVGSLWIDVTADKAYICLDNTNHAAVWTEITGAGGAGGDVATDTIWAAKGDLAVGTGVDTAAILTVGANDTIPMADSGEATGIKWVASATGGNIDGVQAAATGTADTFSRGDHAHRIQHGIADNALVTVDGTPYDDEYARFTANGLEGRSYAEVLSDLGGKVTRCIVFNKTGSVTTNVPLAPWRICVGESGEHGTFTAVRAKITAEAAVADGAIVAIQADDNPAFSSPTTLFTLDLTDTAEADDTVLDNAWAAGDIWIRAYCTSGNTATGQNIVVQFWFTEAVW